MESQAEIAQPIKKISPIPARLPSLDGWRAVSIVLVLIQHSSSMPGWPKVFNFSLLHSVGGVGVRFFFVISGFLITWLLIKEALKNGRVSVKSFYVRRCIRIFPVLYAYLFAVFLLHYFSNLVVTPKHYLIAGTFMCDFWSTGQPLAHLWSLGVEEKFYLFWPLLFTFIFRKRLKNLAIILIILIIMGPVLRELVVLLQLDDKYALFNSHSFLIIYDGLSIGCLGAILLNKFHLPIYRFFGKYNYLLLIIGAVLAGLPSIFWIIPALKALQPLQDTLQCSGFLILMLQSVVYPDFFVYKILNLKFVMHIGLISYSLYIWMGIAELHNGEGIPFLFFNRFPGWIILAIILAELSYNFIESPILKMKKPILNFLGLYR